MSLTSRLGVWSAAACCGLVLAGAAVRGQVVINEILAGNRTTNLDEDGDRSDWVELYNAGSVVVDLEGYALSDTPDDPRRWVFPSTQLAAEEHLLVWCSGKNRTKFDSSLLTSPNSPVPFEPRYIGLSDEWHYVAAPPDTVGPAPDWNTFDFDDSAWSRGVGGFGFGADGIVTEIAAGTTAMFLRRRFTLEPGERTLLLELRYDDGFVAYVNGMRVANSILFDDVEPTFATTSNRSHSPTRSRRFDISEVLPHLREGENVLAIALLNVRANSNDMALFAELGSAPPVLHTNFKVSQDGEPLLLSDPQGRVVDSVELPEQSADQSYARSPDGSGEFLYHLTPTPREPNTGAASPFPLRVEDTAFSHDRGFYDAPFDLVITSDTPGAVIRYTLNGDVPAEAQAGTAETEPVPAVGFLYDAPIRISRTTVVRARAFLEGRAPTNTDTHTYLFVDDVSGQSAMMAEASGLPPRWGSVAADYDMDTDVIGPGDIFDGLYVDRIPEALRSLPSLSITLPGDDLFGSRGIYSQSTQEGDAWERAASVELIAADGNEEFQEDCGLRIQGGHFRSPQATRKHSLRLLFKSQYGASKLNYPLFGVDATDRFDTITLRAGANDGYSWGAARLTEQYTRDEFGRRLQLATGNAASHGRFVHVFLNGLYWGLYNPAERPDRSFSASYYGGDKDNWDSVHDLRATAGDLDAWNQMLETAGRARSSIDAYLELQGLGPDGQRNPALPHLLDVRNYIDYLVVNVWGGNWDWPWKNWWAGRNRSADSTGFKFYSWDFENTMGNNRDRSPLTKNALRNDFSSAGQAHQRLRPSAEYRQLFGDRIHRLIANDGPLTPASLIARYREMADTVELAIVAESARWGDQHHGTPLTLAEWEQERDWILETYLPARTGVVLEQFRSEGLYPAIEAPTFAPYGGPVTAGANVLSPPAEGVTIYTLDGSDPRAIGGAMSAGSFELAAEGLFVDATVRVRARTLVGEEWSALAEADFIVDSDLPLRVTEIMYHPPAPPGESDFDTEDFEFLEIQNVGSFELDLSGFQLRGGIEFDFADSVIEFLAPGEAIVIVNSLEAFESRYADVRAVAGEYGGRLANSSDTIILEGPLAEPILEFTYADSWHPETDGLGSSLVVVDPQLPRAVWGEAASWQPSAVLLGTPGLAEGSSSDGGLQRPGDVSQDGRVNVVDAVTLLDRLFAGTSGLPCEGESIHDGANRVLHDVDGLGRVDLTDGIALLEYVFRRGVPPALGVRCTSLPGCPDACSQ